MIVIAAWAERGMCFAGRTYGNTVSILLANALGLSLALLKGMLVLELAAHDDDGDDKGRCRLMRASWRCLEESGCCLRQRGNFARVCDDKVEAELGWTIRQRFA